MAQRLTQQQVHLHETLLDGALAAPTWHAASESLCLAFCCSRLSSTCDYTQRPCQ